MRLTPTMRIGVAAGTFVLLAGTAAAYVVRAAGRADDRTGAVATKPSGADTGPAANDPTLGTGSTAGTGLADALGHAGQLVFVDSTPGSRYGTLAAVPLDRPTSVRRGSDVRCARVYIAHQRLVCLRVSRDLVNQYRALILDTRLRPLRTIAIPGVPSRARISPDGGIASWTVFVQGDSYLASGFSTRTSVVNLRTGELIASLESFTVVKDGRRYRSADVNFWGVTVARGDTTFYATMSTRGHTYLVRGNLRARTVTTLRENVECPSLSPDGTRLVFKKRIEGAGGRRPWRLYLLDLASMTEKPLAETRSVDDQAAWLDDRTIAYSLPQAGISAYDVWTVPADGSGSPRLLVRNATSPAPLT